MLGALNEPRDGIHRSRPVKGNNSRDIFNAAGSDACAYGGHPGTFQLEDACRTASCQHFKRRGIIFRNGIYRKVRFGPANHAGGIFQNGQVAEPEEVHLQQSELFQCGHGILAYRHAVIRRERDIFAYRFFGNHHTGCMG